MHQLNRTRCWLVVPTWRGNPDTRPRGQGDLVTPRRPDDLRAWVRRDVRYLIGTAVDLLINDPTAQHAADQLTGTYIALVRLLHLPHWNDHHGPAWA